MYFGTLKLTTALTILVLSFILCDSVYGKGSAVLAIKNEVQQIVRVSELWPQGFDPMNVRRLDTVLLHTRFLSLGNDASTFEVMGDTVVIRYPTLSVRFHGAEIERSGQQITVLICGSYKYDR